MSRILLILLAASYAAGQNSQTVEKTIETAVVAQVEGAVNARVKEATEGAVAKAKLARGRAMRRSRPERLYQQGMTCLDRRQWDKAVEVFSAVVQANAERADGALYWKAYSQYRLGRRDEALATIQQGQTAHPNSAWQNDFRQLEQEVRKASGQPVSPEQLADEDLKLLAINSLIHTEPERAVPLLEKILQGSSSPQLKERALFVLAQTNWPKGVELLARAARGGLNPDLQVKALEYLGARGRQNAPLLAEIYSSSSDGYVKRAALEGLGNARAEAELWKVYQTETAPELKRQIVESLFRAGAHDRLFELVKTERDPAVLREAIETIGRIKDQRSLEALRAVYLSNADSEVRREAIDSLARQGSAPVLIDIARKESDPDLKREAVEALSRMKSKEANEFLLEILSK
jgi:HEAT repeat protein